MWAPAPRCVLTQAQFRYRHVDVVARGRRHVATSPRLGAVTCATPPRNVSVDGCSHHCGNAINTSSRTIIPSSLVSTASATSPLLRDARTSSLRWLTSSPTIHSPPSSRSGKTAAGTTTEGAQRRPLSPLSLALLGEPQGGRALL